MTLLVDDSSIVLADVVVLLCCPDLEKHGEEEKEAVSGVS